VAYLIEENRILREHMRGRIRLTDDERRRLAKRGHQLGRRPFAISPPLSRPTRFSAGIGS
jgi:hypothetical protein